MIRRIRSLRRASERGQAAVETAIVLPMMLFVILGTLQLTLMHQARLMMEYAAFNAARSGAVWNMDPDKMKQAALISLLPTMGRTDTLGKLMATGVKAAALNAINGVLSNFGLPEMITVDVLNPKQSDFTGGAKEIEFDTEVNRKKTQLTVRVTYFYELKIPIINMMMFESWYAANSSVVLTGFNPLAPKVKAGFMEVEQGKAVRMAAEIGTQKALASCVYSKVTKGKLQILGAAALIGRYFMPMVATYTIRMQSNPFLHKPGNSGKKWAAPNNLSSGC